MKINKKIIFVMALTLLVLVACAPKYEYKPMPVKDISGYNNQVAVFSASVAAEAYGNRARAKEIFGFDIHKAGVVPVQIAINNPKGAVSLTLASGARVLDSEGNWWEILPSDIVYQRVNDYTEGGLSGSEGVKRTALYGLGGAIIGGAIGVATGTNIGEAIGKGAAVGGAVGATSAILGMGTEGNQNNEIKIIRDFSDRNVANRTVQADEQAIGFLYFPSEMKTPVRLKLNFETQLKTGTTKQSVELFL